MLGIVEGIKRTREREEAIHPPDHKMPCLAGELPEERALLFSKQEPAPDLKKEMPKKKKKTSRA